MSEAPFPSAGRSAPEMVTIGAFNDLAGVRHGFLTRCGGVSRGIYASLNCGPGSGDDRAAVLENRRRAMAALDAAETPLCTVHQVHSPDAVTVSAPWELGEGPKADAMVTDRPGVALGILTADCAPVLFVDAKAGVVGAAHAGWRGAIGGVLGATVEAMEALGAERSRIAAGVGPCIGRTAYEVGPEFPAPFLEQAADNQDFFQAAARPGHFLFDLRGYIARQLKRLSVGDAHALPCDTYTEEQRFFSYRRACHRGEGDYGRLLSAILLEG